MLGINASSATVPESGPQGPVQVCVISSNQALVEACRANLENLCPSAYRLEQCQGPGASASCDIYVWEFDSHSSPPVEMALAKDAIKVVIVKKNSLALLRRSFPDGNFTYLQSPVTPLSLRVALESAVASRHLHAGESAPLDPGRDRLLQKLLETNLKLQDYDQERTNFLTRAVHDVRMPLTAVQGYCGLLLTGQLGSLNPEQAQILERMQRSLTRLGRLAGAMMELGTSDQTLTRPKLENASIEACVQQAVYEVHPALEKKQISLNLEVDPSSEGLLIDAGQIEQVLVNLLENGCKFTPKGGSITIRGRSIDAQELGRLGLPEASGGYRIDISDTGPGINPAHLPWIFDEHCSYEDPMNRAGSGLGLAICRKIIREHNGRIWASSDTQGATFSVVLPVLRSLSEPRVSHLVI